jgi:hypothetical protein
VAAAPRGIGRRRGSVTGLLPIAVGASLVLFVPVTTVGAPPVAHNRPHHPRLEHGPVAGTEPYYPRLREGCLSEGDTRTLVCLAPDLYRRRKRGRVVDSYPQIARSRFPPNNPGADVVQDVHLPSVGSDVDPG